MGATLNVSGIRSRTKNSDALDHAVRVGLVAYGVVHLIVAWLALNLAFGSGKGSASGTGALSQLAKSSLGQISLYVVAVGFFALVVWQLLEAAFGKRDSQGAKRAVRRLASVGKAAVYGTLGASALKLAMGSGSSGSHTDSMTARLMALPAGPLLVGLVGAVILVVAGALVYRGISEGFTDHLDVRARTSGSGRTFIRFGKVGYAAKGLALVAVGALFIWAAWTHNPKKSGGLDQALHEVLQQPFGVPILVVMAAGIACFGLYCFGWARHLDR